MRTIRMRTYPNRGISLPDMAPFAGFVFLLVCYYMLAGRFNQPSLGIVPLEKLPKSKVHHCIPENTEAIIGMDTNGRYSFTVTGPALQAATIKEVAAKQGIIFTAAQLTRLQTLDFLATDVSYLPVTLSQSAHASGTINIHLLDKEQLMDCVKTAKSVVQTLVFKPTYVCLLIDGETKASKVMQLLDALQAHGINRFNLKTQYD